MPSIMVELVPVNSAAKFASVRDQAEEVQRHHGISAPDVSMMAQQTCFRSGREFAAWLGLTPRPNSSGGKERLGRISKMGDGYLRTLLVVGATAVIRYARTKTAADTAWINSLLSKKPARLVSVALANKTARIAWALLARGEVYRTAVVAVA